VVTVEHELPATVDVATAFRAAFYIAEQYIDLETKPDEGLVLFLEYLRSDPACREDWAQAVRTALADCGSLPHE